MMFFVGGVGLSVQKLSQVFKTWSQGYSVITNEAAMELNQWLKSKMEDLNVQKGVWCNDRGGALARRHGVFLPFLVLKVEPFLLTHFFFLVSLKACWAHTNGDEVAEQNFSRLYFSDLEIGYHEFHADCYVDIGSTMGCALKNTPIHRWILWWW